MIELLTVAEAASELKASPRFVLNELARKNLRGSKLNGAGWRISRDDLETYVNAKANLSRSRRS